MSIYGSSLYDMIGSVRDQKPNAPRDNIVRAINRRIRAVTENHAWADLVSIVTVNFPVPYTTGTIALNTGSKSVTGTGTTWPVADYINTESVAPFAQIKQPGYQRVTPASMSGIVPGQWLYIDGLRDPSVAEAVCPVWVDGVSFIAQYSLPHNPNFSIQASSLAGLQIQPAYPLLTITAVVSGTQLLVDQNWGGPSLSNIAYNILRGYIHPDPSCWRVKFANDPVQGIPIDCDSNKTYEQILIGDPQLTTSQNPTVMVPTPFLGGGQVAQWMIYPLIKQAYYLNMIIIKAWPKLVLDLDRSPGFIDSELFICGAKADVLRQKILTDVRSQDQYYDTDLAQSFEAEYNAKLEKAEEHDEAISHHRLQQYGITTAGALSVDYMRSHPASGLWPSDFGW